MFDVTNLERRSLTFCILALYTRCGDKKSAYILTLFTVIISGVTDTATPQCGGPRPERTHAQNAEFFLLTSNAYMFPLLRYLPERYVRVFAVAIVCRLSVVCLLVCL